MLKFSDNTHRTKVLSKQHQEKKLRRIYQGIYTDDLINSIESIVLKNWMQILPHIVSNGILAYRTAVDLKPLPFNANNTIVFVISTYTKTIQLPGLLVKIYRGNPLEFTEQILPILSRSNTARMLLENLSTVRGAAYIGVKTVGVEGVEKLLAKILRLGGEKKLNTLRDEAKQIADALNLKHEYKKLSVLISALLSTHLDDNALTTSYAKAVAKKKPYDAHRIQLFDTLLVYLKQCCFIERIYPYEARTFKYLSFYESYFSNFIEGTEFMIDEAEKIIFKGEEVNHRHADSHDVLSNFLLTNDYSEMCITPQTAEELIDILQRRHALLMKERPEKNPGKFKNKPNKVGNTFFVLPEDVLGTLHQGFKQYEILSPGLEKALFMQFLISEIHPFDDGNGRLSRIMMNAELVNHGNYKIIMPSVHRDSYLNGLRLASRDQSFRTYVKVMDQAQAYTASINWHDYHKAREKLERDDANLTSDEGIPTFNQVLRKLKLSDISS